MPYDYRRKYLITCIDILLNLPSALVVLASEVTSGKEGAYNTPYVSWHNVHHDLGGLDPGVSLSTIDQVPASEWSTNRFSVFGVKWNEWIYVAHALTFFAVFGTTPNMKEHYVCVLMYIPRKLGFRCNSKLVDSEAGQGKMGMEFAANSKAQMTSGCVTLLKPYNPNNIDSLVLVRTSFSISAPASPTLIGCQTVTTDTPAGGIEEHHVGIGDPEKASTMNIHELCS